jgi:hypothetical protein
MKKEYYEQRYLKSADLEGTNYLLEGDEIKLTLRQVLENNKRVILLGDAGIGKSIELNQLFEQLWENQEDDLIPILINLKNFRNANKFEDLIPRDSQWEQLSNLVFILDGLDEISDIQGFISAFELFLHSADSHKFVISCRTNIYERYLVHISGFKTFYLSDLTDDQVRSILINGFEMSNPDLEIFKKLSIRTPFFLKVVADLIEENQNDIPLSVGEILDYFIEFVLINEKQKHIKKGLIDTFQLKMNLTCLALVNELQQKNYITLGEINKIVDKGLSELIENPFLIEIEPNSDKYSFKHRQYQECFVAKLVSQIDLQAIIESIEIPKTNKVHPSYANVVSLLLNLLDDQNRLELVKWLQENDVEVLINSEENRISEEIRKAVFQNYFNNVVINQTLWVGSRSTLTDEKLARFGDCSSNFNFLLQVLQKEAHHRVVKSAVDLLSHFTLSDTEKSKLLAIYLEKLFSKITSKEEMAFILRGIIKHDLHKTEDDLLAKLITQFSNESHASINSALCRMIFETERIDEFFEFVLAEFEYANKLKEREEKDDVNRGVNWLLEVAIFKIKNPDNFITLFAHYARQSIRTYSDSLLERLIEQAVKFNSETFNVVNNLLQRMDNMSLEYVDRINKVIQTLIKKCNGEMELWHYLQNNGKLNQEKWLLAEVANQTVIEAIIDELETSNIEFEYEGFRNILSHESMPLAVFFQNELLKLDFKFNNLIEFNQQEKEVEIQVQDDLTILFDYKLLMVKIAEIFKNENTSEISGKEFYQLTRKYYEKGRSAYKLPIEYNILHSLVDLDLTKLEVIVERLKSAKYLLRIAKDHYEQFKKLELNSDQIEIVREWLEQLSQNFNFQNIFSNNGYNSFRFISPEAQQRFDDFKLIIFFFEEDKFDFKPSQDFLLNSLELYSYKDFIEESEGFLRLTASIENKIELKKKIIENIKKGMFSFSMRNHIAFALENNYDEVLENIRGYYADTKQFSLNDNSFEKYIKKTNDTELLKECSKNTNNYYAWHCLLLLWERRVEIEYIRDKANETLNQLDSEFKSLALEMLFRLGDESALTYFVENYYEMLDKLSFRRVKEFTTVKPSDYGLIEQLFHKVYAINEGFDFHYGHEFIEILLVELSKDLVEYEKIKELLNKIKNTLNKNKDDRKFFYVNLLLGSLENAVITKLSKPMNYKEAAIEAKRILSLV